MNAAAVTKITRARSALITSQPFFGCLALHLEISEAPEIDTMATDGRHLFFNADFVLQMTDAELTGVIVHEVEHCALGHHARLGNRDLDRFNRAADYAINPGIIRAGFSLPAGVLNRADFDGLGAEEIYSILSREDGQQQAQQQQGQQGQQAGQQGNGQGDAGNGQAGQPTGQQGQSSAGPGAGQPGSGQPSPGAGQPGGGAAGAGQPDPNAAGAGAGAGGPGSPGPGTDTAGGGQPGPGAGNPAPGTGNGQPMPGAGQPGQSGQPGPVAPGTYGMGGIMPAASAAEAAAELDRWQVLARQAVNVAKAHNAGTVPGYLESLVSELNAPRVDFRELLAQFIDSRTAWDYSFSRPNRRFVHAGVYLPGTAPDGFDHLVFVVDTSGSITQPMIDDAAAEIAGAMETGKVARVTVLMADTAVRHVYEFEKGADIELTMAGGGGTRFGDSFRWIDREAPDASAVIYLTDLVTSDFGEDPGCPVLWATFGDSRRFPELAAKVPFGEPVYIGR